MTLLSPIVQYLKNIECDYSITFGELRREKLEKVSLSEIDIIEQDDVILTTPAVLPYMVSSGDDESMDEVLDSPADSKNVEHVTSDSGIGHEEYEEISSSYCSTLEMKPIVFDYDPGMDFWNDQIPSGKDFLLCKIAN